MTVSEAAKKTGLTRNAILYRIKKGLIKGKLYEFAGVQWWDIDAKKSLAGLVPTLKAGRKIGQKRTRNQKS